MLFFPKHKEESEKRKKVKEVLSECSQTMDNVDCQIKQFIRSQLELVDKEKKDDEHDVE